MDARRGESDTPETPDKSHTLEDRVSFKSAIRDELLTLLKDPAGEVRDTLNQVMSDQLRTMNVMTSSMYEERIIIEEAMIMDQMRALLDGQFYTKVSDACGEVLKKQSERIDEIERQISEISLKVRELTTNIEPTIGKIESLTENINGL